MGLFGIELALSLVGIVKQITRSPFLNFESRGGFCITSKSSCVKAYLAATVVISVSTILAATPSDAQNTAEPSTTSIEAIQNPDDPASPSGPATNPQPAGPGGNFSLDDGPTLIKADSLVLSTKNRTFEYRGNVEAKNSDLIILADFLEGEYTEDNQIKELVARSNVNISKGESIKAICERAVFDSALQTIVLTENPELQEDGSILTADKITILLNEDRSMAEGQVRVKVVEKADASSPAKLPGQKR